MAVEHGHVVSGGTGKYLLGTCPLLLGLSGTARRTGLGHVTFVRSELSDIGNFRKGPSKQTQINDCPSTIVRQHPAFQRVTAVAQHHSGCKNTVKSPKFAPSTTVSQPFC